MAVIKDVAKLANVSTGTVSKYLNNPENLRSDTRSRVKQAISELAYKPSPLARSMRTKKTYTIAVVAPDISNPFYGEIYNHIRVSLMQKGYTPILYTTEDNMDILREYLSGSSIKRLDGLILCYVEEDETIEGFIEEIQSQVPIVLLSWDISNIKFNSVVIDVSEGIYKATEHLISLGHKNIAYIGGPENNRITREKTNGFKKAMKNAGLEVKDNYVSFGNDTLQAGYQAARKFTMQAGVMPTAIVAEDDFLAIGGLKYLLQNGIKVPDDIAVTGFDDIMLSRMYEPSLSTISLPKEQIGREGVKLLMSRIDKPNSKNKQIILKTELIIRNSTDKNIPVEFEF